MQLSKLGSQPVPEGRLRVLSLKNLPSEEFSHELLVDVSELAGVSPRRGSGQSWAHRATGQGSFMERLDVWLEGFSLYAGGQSGSFTLMRSSVLVSRFT